MTKKEWEELTLDEAIDWADREYGVYEFTTEDMFITKKVIILREAVSLFLFNFCISFIAFKPKGVAALPTPSIFKIMFEDIYVNAS